jgi:hypothetical protein
MEDDVTLGGVYAALLKEITVEMKLGNKDILQFVCHCQVNFYRYK